MKHTHTRNKTQKPTIFLLIHRAYLQILFPTEVSQLGLANISTTNLFSNLVKNGYIDSDGI